MKLEIRDPEVFGVTESSITLAYSLEDAAGPIATESQILLNGEIRAQVDGGPATRLVRIEGLESSTEYRVEIRAAGAVPPAEDRYFPHRVTTLPAPESSPVGSFATLNDLHFGEARVGGTINQNFEYGEEKPGFPLIRAEDTETPYWRFMDEDAVAEINALEPDLAIIKGDIADRGEAHQFEAAAEVFACFQMPHHAILGNHDYYARLEGRDIDGYDLLGQPRAPRTLDLGGWRLVLLETALPGEHHGEFDLERRDWLAQTLAEIRELDMPSLLFMHHQPVPPEHAHRYPNSIGIDPEHSLAIFDLIGSYPQIRGVLIGHTHRNRVRRYAASGSVPYVEVNCVKDYPGGFAHYRLFEDGSFRQEVRRTASERALAHSTRCRSLFKGAYRDFALGSLAARSFLVSAS
ncbi:MAG: metallophosphoesterase [Myxococcota bacterium]